MFHTSQITESNNHTPGSSIFPFTENGIPVVKIKMYVREHLLKACDKLASFLGTLHMLLRITETSLQLCEVTFITATTYSP